MAVEIVCQNLVYSMYIPHPSFFGLVCSCTCCSCSWLLLVQFNSEAFVDGLLGIGVAGGGKTANEGATLAARLEAMRTERDIRAAERKAELVAAAASPRSSRTTYNTNGEKGKTRGGGSNNKKKKKKKNKR